MSALDGAELEAMGAYAAAERKLLPYPLWREREFYRKVRSFVGLLYAVPWLSLGLLGGWFIFAKESPAAGLSSLAGASVLFVLHFHSMGKVTGLWYPLGLWEQSITSRIEAWRYKNPEKSALLNAIQNPLNHF